MEAYLIGTLYEEEEKDKKQNFYNQIVRKFKKAIDFSLKIIKIRLETKKATNVSTALSPVVFPQVTKTLAVLKRAGFLRSLFLLAQAARNTSRNRSCNSWTKRI